MRWIAFDSGSVELLLHVRAPHRGGREVELAVVTQADALEGSGRPW